ncbi:MAG: phosphate acetyltransferase [Nanoarchaeota archaeon]|nr:phosphate acetyltransferase [DPANN group archaeon]MBL7116703.1 phosphate acetyltransferase [Nanoarchaeota archaeon]
MKIDLIKKMEEIAKKKPVKVLVCEGWDERFLRASAQILERKLAKIVLLGDPKVVNEEAKKFGVDVSGAEIVDYKNSELKKELAEKLVEVRKHKGMDLKTAKKLIENENYFGCMYAYCGYADSVAGSAICPTAELMRPALQILRKKKRIVSEVVVVSDVKNNRTLFITDVSLNIDPNAEQLAQIALNAVKCVRSFGIVPKVALLSFSTKGSGGNHPAIQTVRDALEIVKKEDPKLLIDGEMQVDAAVSEFGAQRKCPDSPLKGKANILVFPNLTAANIFGHSILQFSDMTMDFTMLEGLMKPVGIVGRSTPLDTVRNVMVSGAMEANS